MFTAHLAQMRLQRFDRRIAFALVSSRDNEDERFGLRASLQEFVYQASSNAESQTADYTSVRYYGYFRIALPVGTCDNDVEAILRLWDVFEQRHYRD